MKIHSAKWNIEIQEKKTATYREQASVWEKEITMV